MEYEPTRRSVSKHPVPDWYHDAKFGIFIHWSLSSVPAYAPRDRGDIVEILEKEGPTALMANQPYAEWYLNSLRIEGSPVQRYHFEKYGRDYPYFDFAAEFNDSLGEWDPDDWADLFKGVGARYVVFVTKHHDGFLLWPSERPNPSRPDYHATRDVVGGLTNAVKERGMRMGFYYSSALDWSFTDEPIRDFADLLVNGPADRRYAGYAEGHWRELIDRYEPSVLWSDIGYPPGSDLNALFAYFYNRFPDGVVDDRWAVTPKYARWFIKSWLGRQLANRIGRRMFISGKTTPVMTHCDYVTPEYATFSEIREKKWECVRGMGKSFGYNREEVPEDFITVPELVRLLVDIVSKNGNLLLNVGPMLGGTVPEIQRERLLGLGAWLDVNGDAIFETRPWLKAEGETREGIGVRFTVTDESLYIILLGTPKGGAVTVRSLEAAPGSSVRLLGHAGELSLEQDGGDLRILLPGPLPEIPAHAFVLTPQPSV